MDNGMVLRGPQVDETKTAFLEMSLRDSQCIANGNTRLHHVTPVGKDAFVNVCHDA